MIIVISNIFNEAVPALINRFPKGTVSLFTSRDLSKRGTSIHFNNFDKGSIVVSGKKILIRNISGVLTLIANIYPQELVQINKEDREYVSCEMNAFLTWFLSQLKCPMLNRPSATCFSGQLWKTEYWIKLAIESGIPVDTLVRNNSLPKKHKKPVEDKFISVTLIGKKVYGTAIKEIKNYTLLLASAVKLNLLKVIFKKTASGKYKFYNATQFPDVTDQRVSNAIIEFFSIRS